MGLHSYEKSDKQRRRGASMWRYFHDRQTPYVKLAGLFVALFDARP
jgi:hypothetical protein